MIPELTFLVPVRHPENMRSVDHSMDLLARTLRSIANQTAPGWAALVIANPGTPLPPLPEKAALVTVDRPPNPQHELGEHDREAALESFREDKGRRVLAGALAARPRAS